MRLFLLPTIKKELKKLLRMLVVRPDPVYSGAERDAMTGCECGKREERRQSKVEQGFQSESFEHFPP